MCYIIEKYLPWGLCVGIFIRGRGSSPIRQVDLQFIGWDMWPQVLALVCGTPHTLDWLTGLWVFRQLSAVKKFSEGGIFSFPLLASPLFASRIFVVYKVQLRQILGVAD